MAKVSKDKTKKSKRPKSSDSDWSLNFSTVPEELYFGILRAIGVEEELAVRALRQQLREAEFEIVEIRLSDWLTRIPVVKSFVDTESPLSRLLTLSEVANWLRKESDSADALARCAAFEVVVKRQMLLHVDETKTSPKKIAYIFRTLVHEEEIKLFRDLYGPRFFCIAVHDTESRRRESLLNRVLTGSPLDDKQRDLLVDDLLLADKDAVSPDGLTHLRACTPIKVRHIQAVSDKRFRQNLGDAYQTADLFVSPDVHHPELGISTDHVERLLHLIHGDPFVFPTLDELGMAHAFAAVGASASLARQVGAAVCSAHGDFLTSGYNEVPKPGGGVYGQPSRRAQANGREADARDHLEGGDISDRIRREMFRDLMARFATDLSWFTELEKKLEISLVREGGRFASTRDLEELLQDKLAPNQLHGPFDRMIDEILKIESVRDSEFFNVVEYGRSVHAEMQAITTAARRGVSVDRATIYVTTFPCHECTRHIISSGILRVVYVEPYLKSRALQLHPDAISVTDDISPTHIWESGKQQEVSETRPANWPATSATVHYESFRGIAPRRHHELFSAPSRKLSRRLIEQYEKEAKASKKAKVHLQHEGLDADTKASLEREVSNLTTGFTKTLVQGQLVPWDLLRRTTRRTISGDGRSQSRRLLESQQTEEIARFMHLKEQLDGRQKPNKTEHNKSNVPFQKINIDYYDIILASDGSVELAEALSEAIEHLTTS